MRSTDDVGRRTGRDLLVRVVHKLHMGHRNAAAEPNYATRGYEIMAASWPQVVDAEVDGANMRISQKRDSGFAN